MRHDPLAELLRLTEADIAQFEAKLRAVHPTYHPGQKVELHGDMFEVISYQGEGMPGYWLRSKEEVFLPLDWEGLLRPVVPST